MTRALDLTVEEVLVCESIACKAWAHPDCRCSYDELRVSAFNTLTESKRQAFALLQPRRERGRPQEGPGS